MVFSLIRRRASAPAGAACPYSAAADSGPVPPPAGPREPDRVDRRRAEEFLRQFHEETPGAGDADARIRRVRAEIARTGTYEHTPEELAFGDRVAWRNASRCIVRIYW
ncbi:nitric oxide synthase oxygenase, partial [Streptomyces sp. NPDC056049]|uniref:nitric oxide synthase oxygenase n=1 Tax=Streptomyces sp. NPDC056049 TaxID=3345693 RepID=UPI0035DDD8F7